MSEEKRPEWMTSISSTVDPDDYLSGRKIDKTFELSQKEKADKAREARIELISKDKIKLDHDPILDLERRKRQLKMDLIQNPVMMKQFRDKLLRGELDNKALPSGSGIRPTNSKKGRVQVHGAKPELPSFLQRIKEQIVANEHNERRERCDKRRKDRPGGSTNPDDDPTVVKLGDDDLTEAEYKRMKLALETQYKIDSDKSSSRKRTEELDIDQLIKNNTSSRLEYSGQGSSSERDRKRSDYQSNRHEGRVSKKDDSRDSKNQNNPRRHDSSRRRDDSRRHDDSRRYDDSRGRDDSRVYNETRKHGDLRHDNPRRHEDPRKRDDLEKAAAHRKQEDSRRHDHPRHDGATRQDDIRREQQSSRSQMKVLSYSSSDESN